MSNISAEHIKLLREKTGAGMMDCKKALVENDGDISKATSWLRKKGIAKAEKKSSRVAAQGLVGLKSCDNFSLLLEINSETDFVSKNIDFQNFVDNILDIGISKKYTMDSLLEAIYRNNETVAVALQNLVAKIGENIVIRRLVYLDADSKNTLFGTYVHNKINDNIGRMACVVKMFSNDNSNKAAFDLANKISKATNFQGKIVWDKTKPDGTPKKLLNIEKILNLGWKPKLDLDEGIKQIITNIKNSRLF